MTKRPYFMVGVDTEADDQWSLEGRKKLSVENARALPRLQVVSIAEQILLHARRYRAETCRGLLARIDALLDAEGAARGPFWWKGVSVYRDMAEGYAAIAARRTT